MEKNFWFYGCNFVPPLTGIPLAASCRWCGHQRVIPENKYFFDGMHRGSLDVVLWQYTISGCGAVFLDGEEIPVRPGEAFLLTIPGKHTYYLPESSGHWEFLYMGFAGSDAVRIARELRKKSSVSTAYASEATIELAWDILRRREEKTFHDPMGNSVMAYRFMMSLLAGDSGNGSEAAGNLVWQIHNYCLKHLDEDLSVEQLAEAVGFSRSHFCRLFRTLSGKSPHDYLLELRIRTAIQMLQNGTHSVKYTAAVCGFSEIGYFCKVFRRFTGDTPGAFRKKI